MYIQLTNTAAWWNSSCFVKVSHGVLFCLSILCSTVWMVFCFYFVSRRHFVTCTQCVKNLILLVYWTIFNQSITLISQSLLFNFICSFTCQFCRGNIWQTFCKSVIISLCIFLFGHQPYQGLATASMLTETALSRHEQSTTVMIVPGAGRQLNKITAMHRSI